MLSAVDLSPGKLCNNRCVFCPSGSERDAHGGWVAKSRLLEELKALYAGGARAVNFVGGEPSLYPHIVDAVAEARRLGYRRIALSTNGVRLAVARFALRLAAAGVTRVTVSLHSVRPEVEEAITGVSGVLERKLRAVRILAFLNSRGRFVDGVSLNPVLCRANLDDIAAYVGVIRRLGVHDIRFNYIWPRSRARRDRSLVPAFAEAVPRIMDFIEQNERGPYFPTFFGFVPFCVLPFVLRRTQLFARYFNVRVRDLERFNSVADPKTANFRHSGWNDDDPSDFKADLAACRACPARALCPGVWQSYAQLYGDSEFAPVEGA